MSFADRLKKLRESRGWTQEDLADKLGVSRATIAGYETKGKIPRDDTLIAIADLFNTSTDYLFGRTDLRHPIIDPDLGADISDLTPEEVEFLNELKEEVAFKDFLKDPEEKKRELIETVKMLMRGRKK
ncbi:helix-turn-helix transcriptional regulator [Alicyclobacillus fastidiosus]|uniref:Helix-turn-helix transcriptional regulator n=1 Tax=Alicyclobacillus fastidiosus TaxID=392011 RepID=A0ABY6ZN40_9BACL|nr:helix-turn-helix transcriptional regulator [Alicyclobacillus fastidiosus]WAH43526.1 helix-turn-helix transcriptional regulator [Alicyclobacillus fastidiosus]GMA59693.1 hypothetical protein GCM10025859_01330 [Alicyclobacillus fastidiosus]GMA65543.1 hypothetical protein GCM10025859_59830 [Alicyclobacillus fastidiosus]